jgi:hypothetical protein
MANITISREDNLVELHVKCSGRKGPFRCKREMRFKMDIWTYYGKESLQILEGMRRMFWCFGWKEQPQHKGGGMLCPDCKGGHDPHRTGHFPPYLNTPR